MSDLSFEVIKLLLIAGGIYLLCILTYIAIYAVMLAIILGVGYTLFKTWFLI